MRQSILQDRTPSLFLLHYNLPEFTVQNVILIPHFVFSVSILEKRRPLSADAERAGWVGCNFLLDRIPADARIDVVHDGKVEPKSVVRENWRKLRPLEKLNVEKRGWTLDILNIVRSLNLKQFSLRDVYAYEHQLAKLHPKNVHVRDKIRQQLQLLRDMGFLDFLGGGSYRLH